KYEVLPRSDADFGAIVSVVDDEQTVPVTYKLEQNYPNPFNPTTTIQYGIAKEGLVKLTIYNILGQEVKTLVNTSQNAGVYKIQWNGLDNQNRMVANGIYIYRIVSNDFVKSKKMVFLK
ncbi:MAG: T9SS type A sorting domain-containing protein, partial [Candidatus Marinimicrobia bacterium]|nr:T9SS type A sorting domain-containing protein [Candidatus Neomarinimicrobiota bacterium]